jgi:hypothetical protein
MSPKESLHKVAKVIILGLLLQEVGASRLQPTLLVGFNLELHLDIQQLRSEFGDLSGTAGMLKTIPLEICLDDNSLACEYSILLLEELKVGLELGGG